MRYYTLISLVAALAAPTAALNIPPQEFIGLDPIDVSNENVVDPCSLVDSTSVNASVQLSSWLECQINGFYPFPANTDWPNGHASAFSKNVKFTFNDTHYDRDGSLKLYKSFNATLGRAFAPFKHGFINTLGIPSANGDKGGFVYMIGWAGGFQQRAKREMYFTNAAFAVVKEEQGQRKIVEFRESSNIPNTAPLPDAIEWGCSFK
ncbi:Nn.00g083510.m01.CDS01 [Neocucurbitaria sp. VM-36]